MSWAAGAGLVAGGVVCAASMLFFKLESSGWPAATRGFRASSLGVEV